MVGFTRGLLVALFGDSTDFPVNLVPPVECREFNASNVCRIIALRLNSNRCTVECGSRGNRIENTCEEIRLVFGIAGNKKKLV